ncbi:MAG: hypothetical protein JWN32_960 [Solirubrobacterales bacterium]|nr:hypothetical protein [Solirubrobacterales bacterium]
MGGWVAVGCVVAFAGPAGADTGPAGIEGCVVAGRFSTPTVGGLAVHLGRCTYKATRRAGYLAIGDQWSIVVERASGPVVATTTYSSSNGAHRVCDAVIHEGDRVTVTAVGNSVALAGNPVPAATDFLPTGTGLCVA